MWFEVKNLEVSYREVPALRGVSLGLDEGELIAIIGPNGAGKTTLLRSISGLVRPTRGEIWFEGQRVDALASHQIVARGIAHIPEGRRLFPDMSSRENLDLGAYLRRGQEVKQDLATVERQFPILKLRGRQRAGSLSGGEQQMLAIGRGLMSRPRLLMLDEPSVGLAPKVVQEIGRLVMEISAEYGVGIILVEQNARVALSVTSRAYVIELGRVSLSGASAELIHDRRVQESYLSA
jgi:branched-chain amino acid transport system ATP-binding protein